MFNFLPLLLIFLGLAGLAILFSRHQGEVEKKEAAIKIKVNASVSRFSQWRDKLIFYGEKLKIWFIRLLEKIFHRLRLSTLRLENFLTRSLKNIQETKEVKKAEEEPDLLDKIKELNKPLLDEEAFIADVILKFQEEEKRLWSLIKQNTKDLEAIKNLARLYLNNFDWPDARYVLICGFRFAPEDKTIQSLMIELWEKEKNALEKSA